MEKSYDVLKFDKYELSKKIQMRQSKLIKRDSINTIN